jgi:hypothetical protein
VTLGNGGNPSRTFSSTFGLPTPPANTVYMPITGYKVTYCQVPSNNSANANCNANTTFSTTMGTNLLLTGLGAQLPAATTQAPTRPVYRFTVTALNLAGESATAQTYVSR